MRGAFCQGSLNQRDQGCGGKQRRGRDVLSEHLTGGGRVCAQRPSMSHFAQVEGAKEVPAVGESYRRRAS